LFHTAQKKQHKSKEKKRLRHLALIIKKPKGEGYWACLWSIKIAGDKDIQRHHLAESVMQHASTRHGEGVQERG